MVKPEESLIEYPSQFPIKVMGENVEGFAEAIINVVTAHAQSWDLATKKKWAGPIRIELELMVPQGSNSGVYVMGEYEVQVLDSHGKALSFHLLELELEVPAELVSHLRGPSD